MSCRPAHYLHSPRPWRSREWPWGGHSQEENGEPAGHFPPGNGLPMAIPYSILSFLGPWRKGLLPLLNGRWFLKTICIDASQEILMKPRFIKALTDIIPLRYYFITITCKNLLHLSLLGTRIITLRAWCWPLPEPCWVWCFLSWSSMTNPMHVVYDEMLYAS